ncbi:unnamed protein product [Adineta steineri]|uniref:Uncharacterized protein n=1 Tax=Adineta steineri TaxID=433720 RepID=A0A815F7T1_9BILA|nr:unnamed protein product [Adineta steineri]
MDAQHKDTRSTSQQQQQQHVSVESKRRRKRCPDNRKLRRFKKKCIRRGLNKEETRILIDKYNHKKNTIQTNPISNDNNEEMVVATTTENKKTKRKSNKRKRITTSASSRSITHQLPKKMKRQNILINHVSQQTNDNRLPKYLRKAPNLLFQALRLKLTKKINTAAQQRFLHHRLQFIDQQYRLDFHQSLWQSYLSLGSEHEI